MLKEQARLFTRIAVYIDAVTIGAAFLLAYQARAVAGGLADITDYLWLLLVIIPVWYFFLTHYGLYASLRTTSLPEVLSSLVKTHVAGGIIASSAIYFVVPQGFSRALFGSFLVLSFLFISIEKAVLKGALSYFRIRGFNTRNILVVGTGERAREFINLVRQHAAWGLRVVGVLALEYEEGMREMEGSPVLGRSNELVEICKQSPVDEVAFCVSRDFVVEDHLRDMDEMGITVRMILHFEDVPSVRREISVFHNDIPMLTFYSKAFDAGQLFLKRCLDILGAIVGLAITAFLFPFIALAIRLDSKGPLFFAQDRVGENGRIFKCWKFRSMYVDAEERKKELMACNEMNGAMFKMKDDPRITKVGRFIRKTSLDELPQFWNVLRGEMSLVGTRPPTPDEVATYENWHRKRICIKPGITGLWQVSGRNQIQNFDDVVRLDLEYIDRWTLWLDIKLIFKTMWVVFVGRGSC